MLFLRGRDFRVRRFLRRADAVHSTCRAEATAQLPVLLKPQFSVHECLDCASPERQLQAAQRRIEIRSWRKLWQNFKSSSISSFGFVESSGPWAVIQLLRQMFGYTTAPSYQRDGLRTKTKRFGRHCVDLPRWVTIPATYRWHPNRIGRTRADQYGPNH